VIKILVVDDHAIFGRGVNETFVRELENVICGGAGNVSGAFRQVQTQEWDLVVLDITMPGRSGLVVLRELVRLKPRLPVLVLSAHAEDEYGRRVLKAGASGYLNKQGAIEELIAAVRKILGGGQYVSDALAEKLVFDFHEGAMPAAHERLSGREFEILRMIASGNTLAHIAKELHLSITTVSTYRMRVLEKLKMQTTADLIRYALQNHLVD
jgi:two-component system invasion response regulator UvrY